MAFSLGFLRFLSGFSVVIKTAEKPQRNAEQPRSIPREIRKAEKPAE
jgi:hypothetical protein